MPLCVWLYPRVITSLPKFSDTSPNKRHFTFVNISRSIILMRPYVIILLGLIISSCGNDESTCGNSFEVPFEIREGRTFCLPNNTSIFIEEITESYCPCNVDCIWEGEAQVTFTASGELGEVTETIHEKRNQDDVPWASIASVSLTETCDPDIASISIVVSLQ